eukprot:SAG11_NODE_106_length_16423_cov_51.220840_8_plen_68_part_00
MLRGGDHVNPRSEETTARMSKRGVTPDVYGHGKPPRIFQPFLSGSLLLVMSRPYASQSSPVLLSPSI